jgi:hypothetical protein
LHFHPGRSHTAPAVSVYSLGVWPAGRSRWFLASVVISDRITVSYGSYRINGDPYGTVTTVEFTKLNEPYEVVEGREAGRLVQVTIRAIGENAELGYDEIREATRSILDRARREHLRSRPTSTSRESEALSRMADAYHRGGGKVTDEYLAALAVAYEEAVAGGKIVVGLLSGALGNKPIPTIKGHIMRARQSGFLSATVPGKEGGEASDEARKLVAKMSET